MAKERDTATRRLFRDPSGQGEMFDKSFEEELETRRNQPIECLGMTFSNDDARREHFLGILREKLKDPKFRAIEGFPIGSDEDILALSDPPYYTACPNPFIVNFIKHHGKPYDPNEAYSRGPFDNHGDGHRNWETDSEGETSSRSHQLQRWRDEVREDS